jgi:uncharacterized protein
MADLLLRSEEDVRDFVRGCAFYGVGGGGDPALGLKVLLEDFAKSGEIRISDPQGIRDEAWVCCSSGPGTIAPPSAETIAKMERLGLKHRIGMADRMYALAVMELENYAHVEIEAIVASELGGYDGTPAPIDAAISLGKKIVNGDFAGRSVPEEEQSTLVLGNIPYHPVAFVDPWGNVTILKRAINYAMGETLSKMISVAACSYVGAAGFLMRGREMKKVLIPNTLSECFILGQTISKAVTGRSDPADAIAETTHGWVIFRGKITKKEWEDKDGYMWGTNTVKGQDAFRNHELKVYYKNENHISWLDGMPYVTSPDLISVVRKDSGEPLTNATIGEGDEVSVLGLRGREPFRTGRGLEVLGPRHFGFEIDYVPIEAKMRQKA